MRTVRWLPVVFAAALVGLVALAQTRSRMAPSASGSNSGDVTIGTGNGLTLSGQALSNTCSAAGKSGALCNSGGVLAVDAGVVSVVASGVNAFEATTTGARIKLGAGANAWFDADSSGTFTAAAATTNTGWKAANLQATVLLRTPQINCATTGCTILLQSEMTAASASATAGAVVFATAAALDATDALVNVKTSAGTDILSVRQNGMLSLGGAQNWSGVAPTVPVACTSPTITHGTAVSFQADVGTSCGGVSTFAVTMPLATNGWHCTGRNVTNALATLEQTAESTTSITMTNYTRTTGVALVFTDADDLVISCTAR